MHIVWCAVLALVVVLAPLRSAEPSADASATTAFQVGKVTALDVRGFTDALAPVDASVYPPASAPANGLVLPTMGDVAGDLPELLVSIAAQVVMLATPYRQTGFKLRVLPHPFLQRPQRPPRHTSQLT